MIESKSQPHGFTLACVLQNPDKQATEIQAIIFRRQENELRIFVPDSQVNLPMERILFVEKNAKLFQKDNELILRLTKQLYENIRSQVLELDVEHVSSEGDMSGEEMDVSQSAILLAPKKLTIKGKKKNEPILDKNKFKFVKGKENPFVPIINHSQQFNAKSSIPNFSCCIYCNEQEITRAVRTNDMVLLHNIFQQASEKPLIDDVLPQVGLIGQKGIVQLCLELKRFDMLDYLLDED